jgi:hypothetical protein
MAIVLLLGVPACLADIGSGSRASTGSDDVDDGADGDQDRDDCKIENEDIGVIGVVVDVGGTRVTFVDWIAKDGEAGEFIGFVVSVEGGELHYRVKAGGESYNDTATTWMHPNGTGGPEVSAISNVDMCPPDDGDGGEGGDPGDGGEAGDPGDGGQCEADSDCGTGELCENGSCQPPVIP